MKHLNIQIYGKVQGVFFRHNTCLRAEEFKINGFVRNEPDGTVYIEAEGEEENIEKFLEWCKQGSESAVVEDVKITGSELKHFSVFQIQY